MRVALSGLLVVALVGAAVAEEPPDPMQFAREAYAAWQKVKATAKPPEPPPGASEAMRSFRKTGPTAATVNEAVFGERFSKTDLTAWDADKEPNLVREGLRLTAQDAYRDGRAGKSVQACDLFIARYPKHDATPRIRGVDLPSALILNDAYERAVVVSREHAHRLTGILGANACLLWGDLETLHREPAAARAAYDRAFGHTLDPETTDFDVNTGDWAELGRKVDNIWARQQIVARKKWLGAKFSKLKLIANVGPAYTVLKGEAGNLVLWASPKLDPDMLGALDKLTLDDGARVRAVAVTWQVDGASATASRYRLDLRDFRKEHALSIPIAVLREKRGDALIGKHRKSLMMVVDRKSRIAFVSRPNARGEAPLAVTMRLVRAFARRTPAPADK